MFGKTVRRMLAPGALDRRAGRVDRLLELGAGGIYPERG